MSNGEYVIRIGGGIKVTLRTSDRSNTNPMACVRISGVGYNNNNKVNIYNTYMR